MSGDAAVAAAVAAEVVTLPDDGGGGRASVGREVVVGDGDRAVVALEGGFDAAQEGAVPQEVEARPVGRHHVGGVEVAQGVPLAGRLEALDGTLEGEQLRGEEGTHLLPHRQP